MALYVGLADIAGLENQAQTLQMVECDWSASDYKTFATL